MSNKTVFYSPLGQLNLEKGRWEMVASRKRPHSKSKVFRLKKRGLIEAGSVGEPSSNAEKENVLNDIAPAASTLLPDAGKKAI